MSGEKVLVPRLFVEAAVIAAGGMVALVLVYLVTYWVASQHGYALDITFNHYGEFWWEIAMFFVMLGLGVAVAAYGVKLVRPDTP
jgi:hypothetical protein